MAEWRLEFRGTLFPVRGAEITLGRSSYASIVVNNPRASREHAVVRLLAGGGLEIKDLGSRNGTFVNGQRLVVPRKLEVGDQIGIGADVIDVLRTSAEDPTRLRAVTLPGAKVVIDAPTEEETTEIARRP